MQSQSLLGKVFTLPLIVSAVICALSTLSIPATAAPTEPYTWKNVRIDGGGFVPGIIFNQTEPDLIYARTDIGGAYRWNPANNTWIPLLDWVGWDNWGWNGVLSLATDPVDPDRVYAAVGMYTNAWDPNNGAIIRSADRGASWQVTELPFKVGGNMPGRGMGERLAIDPNNNSILYFGAEDGNGLWRSADYGATWSQVTNFPNVGNYAQDPADPNGYLNITQGVVWVSFDQSSGAPGSSSQTIYVGVADKENPVYRSLDGGVTWSRVPGQPTGYLPHKGIIDHVNGFLYIATSDTGGPYDGGLGDVWKLELATDTWTNISPIPSASPDAYFGYSGLTIDRQNPSTLMVASQISWWPDAIFFRSTDGGATWSRIWDWTSYPSRSLRYELDITEVPWLNFGNTSPVEPEPSPKLGWMNESVEIDPHNSNRLMYGTGATIYGTDNLTQWDTGGTITIRPMVEGLEETAVLDLISPPSGAPLFSALGDIGGFRHDDLTQVPATMFTMPNTGNTTSIDFAELNPSIVVRVGNDIAIGVSTSGGSSWWQAQVPSGATSSGTVAVAADGSAIVWSPSEGAGVHYSTTYGSNWTASTGVPAGAIVESDRVNPAKFYALSEGTLYVSTNGGASFTAAANTLPVNARKFKAVPGYEGDIWVTGGTETTDYGVWRSTDSGANFTKFANVEEADNVGFGKAAPGQTYPAVYLIAQVDGVRGVYRSNDTGASWIRINDDAHQYGNFGEALTGDPRIYGRIYLGTNGRGVIYGDSAGTLSSSSSSSVSSSSSSSVVSSSSSSSSSVVSSSSSVESSSSSVASSASSSSGNSTGISASYTVTNSWGSGYCANVTVTNEGTQASTWSSVLTVEGTVTNLWNATWAQSGSVLNLSGVQWNATLQPGQSHNSIGFCANN